MSIKIPTINCLFCGTKIPDNQVSIRKLKVPGTSKKQYVHNTDTCSLIRLGFKDDSKTMQNCYRRHQDFKKKLGIALNSELPEVRRFARKCLWQMIERKPTKYMNLQLKSIKPFDDELLFKKFRNFCKKPMVVMVQ